MAESDALLHRLRAAADALAALRRRADAAGPWPLAERFDHAPEANWGPPEILAHVAEMLPYWLGEAERILDGPPDAPAIFGRVADDPVRLAIIARDRSVPLRDLFDRAEWSVRRYEHRLPELSAGDLARRGRHPTGADLPLSHILERFVVGHLEEHVRQLEAVVG